MSVGGMAVNKQTVPRIARDIHRINPGLKSEIKWENANWRGGVIHRAFIDLLFSLVEQNLLHFHIRFAPFSEYDHARSGERRRHDTVSKMYYQLLLHRPIRHYGDKANLYIYPDDGDCTSYLPNMIEALHNDASLNWGNEHHGCIADLKQRKSRSEPFLQLLDVTIGALTCYRNGRHEDGSTGAIKSGLARYAFEKTGWRSITASNQGCRMSVWNVRPKWGAKNTRPSLLSRLGRG